MMLTRNTMKFINSFAYVVVLQLFTTMVALGQGSISPNSTSVCVNGTATFTASGSTATSGYVWTVPTGATIISGAGTKTVTVRFSTAGMGMAVFVSGNGLNTGASVSVYAVPGTPGTIQGPSTVCVGGKATFYLTQPIANAHQTSWVATNATVLSSTSTSVEVSFPSGYTSGSIIVYGIAGPCGAGPTSQKSVTGGPTVPLTPGSIQGPDAVAPGAQNVDFFVTPVTGAAFYVWTLPAGATFSGASNGSSIKVNFPNPYTPGTISVAVSNGVCTGNPSSKPVSSSNLPGSPGTIGGSFPICLQPDGVYANYLISPISNATGYTWSVTGGSIMSGQGTTAIQVFYPGTTTSASVSVYGTNSFGSGPVSSQNVQIFLPAAAAGLISGPTEVCAGTALTNVSYSIPAIAGSPTYVWTLPTGVTLKTGSNSPSITVDIASTFTGGSIGAFAVAGFCGPGPSSTVEIKTIPATAAPGSITGRTSVCKGSRSISYSVPAQPNTNYVWTVPAGASIISGLGTNQIFVDFTTTFASGNISVHTSNTCGTSATSTLSVTANASTLPVITQHPVSQSYYTGMPNVSFSVVATGTGLLYQWRKNGNNIFNATGSSYSLSSVQYGDEANYDVIIMNSGGCSITSQPARLTVKSQISENYVISRNVRTDNQFKEDEIAGLPVDGMEMMISYFDGLGRVKQEVNWQNSPGKADQVLPHVYDNIGREHLRYLPFISSEANGFLKTVSYTSEFDYSHDFYRNTTDKVADDARPFTQTVFEAAPSNRPLKTFGPGKHWFDNSKSTEYKYLTNVDGSAAGAEKIIAWKIDGSGMPVRNTVVVGGTSGAGYYPTGRLLVSSVLDDNGNETREYHNRSGKIILKKSYVKGTKTDFIAAGNWAETYFVYDDLGRLRFIFQPELSKALASSTTTNPTTTQLNQFSFQYKYDSRARLVEKRIPGADPVFLIYNKRDLLVMTQDGSQRNGKSEWHYTKYDVFGRPVITGMYTHNSTTVGRDQMAAMVTNTAQFETFNGNAPTWGYTNNMFAEIFFVKSGFKILTVKYYDNYDFKPVIGNSNYNYVNNEITEINPPRGRDRQELTEFQRVDNQVTGTVTNVLGTSTYLWNVTYYDARMRPIQVVTTNHKGGIDRTTNRYDYNDLRDTKNTHKKGAATYSVARHYDFDHARRLTKVWHKINSDPEILLTQNGFNPLGQVVTKSLHSRDEGAAFLQKVEQRYNIRGWLDRINDPSQPQPGDLFSMKLSYNQPTLQGSSPQYNGNISALEWISVGQDKQAFAYAYDGMSRMTQADYHNLIHTAENGKYTEKITSPAGTDQGYDLNGNILRLARYGRINDTQFGLMDDLTYTYTGNQVTRIDDAIAKNNAENGFKENIKTSGEYTYDLNGSMLVDQNKGITAITYNHLRLPVQVNKGPSDYIVYTYDANGTKLSQQVFGSAAKTTDYIGDFIYEGDVLQLIKHEEGRIVPDAAGPRPWEYQYHLKDHLGNIRVTFSEKKATTSIKATLENATATTEQATFKGYGNRSGFNLFDHTDTGTTNTYSQLLNGGNNGQVGLGKSYEVNAGDVFDVEVFAKFEAPSSTPNNINGLLNALTTVFNMTAGSPNPLEGQQALTAFNSTFSAGPYIGRVEPAEDATAPKAYLNYLLFDQNYALVDFGFDQINISAKQVGSTPVVPHDLLALHVQVKKKGYLFIYVSNEDPYQTNVYFDDLQINHNSHVQSSSDYYPFGLTFNSWSRDNGTAQDFKFNGKEEQTELGVAWLDFGMRMYQADIGRFFAQDGFAEKYLDLTPYQYGANNPLMFVDINGDSLNVAHLRDNNPEANSTLISDLEEKTGLSLSVDDEGNVSYASQDGKASVAKDKDGKKVGSRAARKALIKLIDADAKVTVKDYPNGGTRVDMDGPDPNVILFDSKQIDGFIAGTSKDLNPTTYGYALNFFHELGHTAYAGAKLDPMKSPHTLSGPVEALPNRIRRQLGGEYGQRVVYAQVLIQSENKTYMAFSQQTLQRLQNQQSPKEKYILIEDFNKK
jgi:RHS repeat-associated protein